MKQINKFLLFTLLIFSTAGNVALAQIEKVDYLWLVDVSSNGRNIYIEGIQHAIDTFYVAATEKDNLHAYNFAKKLYRKDELADADFKKYSDLTAMLEGLDSLIANSQSHYVRAFILSDFINDTPLAGAVPINPNALDYLRNRLLNTCQAKDVKIFLLVTPPTSDFHGLSLKEIQKVLPQYCTKVRTVTPDQSTTDFLIQQVKEADILRGISAEGVEVNETPVTTYIVLCLLLAVLVGTILYFYVNKTKNNKLHNKPKVKHTNTKQKR